MVTIFPNPASDKLVVRMLGISNAIITVFDVAGNKIDVNSISVGLKAVLDVQHLAPGIYQIEIITNGIQLMNKFVIE